MTIEVVELEPGRFDAVVSDAGRRTRHLALVPAGVGVPGVTDEDVVATVIEVLRDLGHEVPPSFDVTGVIRSHPEVWAEVVARLD